MRPTAACLFVALSACAAGVGSVDAGESPDTGAADSGGSDGSDGTEPEPDPEPDFSAFSGTRSYVIDSPWDSFDCDDTSVDEGIAMEPNGDLESVCEGCERFYELRIVEGEGPCSLDFLNEMYLGGTFGEASSLALIIDTGRGLEGFEAAEVEFDGFTATYRWELDFWGTETSIEGTFTFPEL